MNWNRLRTSLAPATRRWLTTALRTTRAATQPSRAAHATTTDMSSSWTPGDPNRVSPDSQLTPRSRKPIPHIVQTRNAAGPYEAPGLSRPLYPKRKSPFKRCKALLDALATEETLRLVRERRAMFALRVPDPRAGDVITVSYVRSLAADEPTLYFTGVVIAMRKKRTGSTVILRNVVEGVAIERGFPFYSPLVKDAVVVGRKKRVRTYKLYYLRGLPLKESTVPGATKKPAERSS